MTVILRNTTKVVTANGVECRVWEGVTGTGIPVTALIPRIAVKASADLKEFENQLAEKSAPTAEIEAWPLRMIL